MNQTNKDMDKEFFIKKLVSAKGEDDGVCVVYWIPDTFYGVVKNMGNLTDIIGAYLTDKNELSFSVHSADDTDTRFPVGFEEFEPEVQDMLVEYAKGELERQNRFLYQVHLVNPDEPDGYQLIALVKAGCESEAIERAKTEHPGLEVVNVENLGTDFE